MKAERLPLEELNGLIDGLLAHSLDAEQLERLNTLLRSSDDARQVYLVQLAIHADLVLRSASLPTSANLEDLCNSDHEGHAIGIVPRRLPAPGEHSASQRAGVSHRLSGWRRLRTAAARKQSLFGSILGVAMLFYGTFGLIVWQMAQDRFAGSRPDAALSNSQQPEMNSSLPEPQPADAPDQTPGTAAVLVSAEGCRWKFGGKEVALRSGLRLRTSDALALLSGTAQIQFRDGAMVLLEGPAQFTIEEAGRGKLDRGKLLAHVPQQAVGFTVATPTSAVVDLGTEFGVEVGASGESSVHVITGCVTVEPEHSVLATSPFKLEQGEAIKVSAEGVVRVDGGGAPPPWLSMLSHESQRRVRLPLLFHDTFSTPRAAKYYNDFGANVDLKWRQIGLATPIQYVLTHGEVRRLQVNRHEEPDYLAPHQLILFPDPHHNPFVCAALDYCFPPNVQLTAYCDPAVDDTKSNDWLAIGLRASAARLDAPNPLEETAGGVALGVRSNGGWFVHLNGRKVAEGTLPELAGGDGSLAVQLRVIDREFTAWLNYTPLDLNGDAEGVSLELNGAAAEPANFVWIAGNATESPTPAHRGFQGHRLGKLEIREMK
jgi:hypothetical protein